MVSTFFFNPSTLNEHDCRAVLDALPALDVIADHIEGVSRELEIPLTIWAGIIHPERRTVGMLMKCDPAIRQNIPAHREFTRRLCQTYHCETAGVDVADDAVWLCNIDFSKLLEISEVQHGRPE